MFLCARPIEKWKTNDERKENNNNDNYKVLIIPRLLYGKLYFLLKLFLFTFL